MPFDSPLPVSWEQPVPSTAAGKARLSIDRATADNWLGGGLKADGLHEFYAAKEDDTASATGFALLVARLKYTADHGAFLWVRETHRHDRKAVPYGPGLLHLGIDPDDAVVVNLPDARAVLRAGLDGVRTGTTAVLIELAGRQTQLDLTTTRRFALAAEEKGVLVLLSRSEADPTPSAAHTRWRIGSAPSCRREADAPGQPCFDLTLLRQRGGRDGLRLILEWHRDTASFRERIMPAEPIAEPASLPRPVSAMAGGGTGGAQRHRAA